MVTRIRQLLDTKQLTPTQFADFIGVGRPVMSHILSERNKPSLEVVQRIISAFPEVSLAWLLSGTGDMLGEATVAAPAALAPDEALLAAPLAPDGGLEVEPVEPATELAIASHPAGPEQTQPSQVAATPPAAPGAPAILPVAPAAPAALALPAVAAAPSAPIVAQPLRATRFVPSAAPSATSRPLAAGPSPFPAPVAAQGATLPVPPAPAASPATTPIGSEEPAAAALLPFLADPGKAIRRIVIFYRDGSFADYHPEA